MKKVIGIDSGANGAIAFSNGETTSVIKMPDTTLGIVDFIGDIERKHGKCIVFIEKVQLRPSDMKGGKGFGIVKLLSNYNSLITVVEMMQHPIIEVHPATWQKLFKKRLVKGVHKNPKMAYRDFAQILYPNIKCTLWNADALLILNYGKTVVSTKPHETMNKIKNKDRFHINLK